MTAPSERSTRERTPQDGIGTRAVGVVVARFDSARLPGKVLARLGDRPLLWWVIARARRAENLNEIVLATSTREVDDPIAQFGQNMGLPICRGPAEDVVARVLQAGNMTGANWIVRLNADSPFVEPALVDCAIGIAHGGDYDLVTNLFPRSYPYGVSAEVVRHDTLARAHSEMDQSDCEHLTRFLYRHPERFSIYNILSESRHDPEVRLVVDTQEDLDNARTVVADLGAGLLDASFEEIANAHQHFSRKGNE